VYTYTYSTMFTVQEKMIINPRLHIFLLASMKDPPIKDYCSFYQSDSNLI